MEVAHGELSPSRDPKRPAACGSVALQFSPSSLNHAPRLLGAPALIARCSLEREDVGAKEPGYLGSSSALLMQALLLGPRQLSGSNYLLWVPPRAKLSLGFFSQTSKDLPGESSMEKPSSLCPDVCWKWAWQGAQSSMGALCLGSGASWAVSLAERV